jgi:hypothetical protein
MLVWRYGSIFLEFDTRWGCVFRFTSWSIYPLRNLMCKCSDQNTEANILEEIKYVWKQAYHIACPL